MSLKQRLDVLEMSFGKHDGGTIARLLETVLRRQGLICKLPTKLMDRNNNNEWIGPLCPNLNLVLVLNDENDDKEFCVVMEEQERKNVDKIIDDFMIPDVLEWTLKRDKVVEVNKEKIEIGNFARTTVVSAEFKSDKMKNLLQSMATKGEFKFAIEMVLRDVNVNGTKEVVWFSALVKQLNANGMTLADGGNQMSDLQ